MLLARSTRATAALDLVTGVQRHMVTAMEALEPGCTFAASEWLRDEGRHGGGRRFGTGDTATFDRASVNVSQVHYDDDPSRRLASATALSTIIHPRSARAPSVHMHLSYTELRDGTGGWRLMSDLNPAIEDPAGTARFVAALRSAMGEHHARGSEEGARYFWIPTLARHRGVAHFYLEDHRGPCFEDDAVLARTLGFATIDVYAELVRAAIAAHPRPDAADVARQRAYHTLYLFQVLTLDRGTTSGLLIHDQNDLGIMGSLPSHVDRTLLDSWATRVPAPQGELVRALVAAIPSVGDGTACPVDDATKLALAAAVRAFYRAHPEALALQAAGSVIPPTVENHRA